MKGFGEIDTSGFTGFVDEIKEKFDPLGAIFGAIEKVFKSKKKTKKIEDKEELEDE